MSKQAVSEKREIRKSSKILLFSLCLLIVCSLVNRSIVTGAGNVRITRINLVGDNGMRYSALMYVPKNATNETPAPGIMMYHGNSGNARNHESWALEFSRRGFVVIAIDNLGAGNGEYSQEISWNATPKLFTDYMYSLPFVDTDNITLSKVNELCPCLGRQRYKPLMGNFRLRINAQHM